MEENIPPDAALESYLESKPTKRAIVVILGLLLLGVAGFLGISAVAKSNKPDKSHAKGQEVTHVTVAEVTQKTVPVQLQAIGSVQAYSTVSITPEVGGIISGVYFKRGQVVKQGQLLFTLDDRTEIATVEQDEGNLAQAKAQVDQAKANLAKDLGAVEQAKATLAKDEAQVRQNVETLNRDKAQAKYAKAQDQRYGQLYYDGAISLDEAQQFTTNNVSDAATLKVDKAAIANAESVVKSDQVGIVNAQAVVQGDRAAIVTAEAVVKSDEAALRNAQVQLSYTKIYAPITGRAGNILLTPGNVVQANSTTAMLTITQIRPILVSFSVPELDLPNVESYKARGKLEVTVTFSNDPTHPIPGFLTFINNTVDNTTGTIQLIGDFDNARGHLYPGEFVNTTLTLKEEPNATVAPAQSVQNGPNGQFVFRVKPDKTVENVPVTVSRTVKGLAVIAQGLQPGDEVVTDGQGNLVQGSEICTTDCKAADSSGHKSRRHSDW